MYIKVYSEIDSSKYYFISKLGGRLNVQQKQNRLNKLWGG